MNIRKLIYTGIILFPFFSASKANAQNRERHRSVTINQTVIDGKVISSDTTITYTDTTTRTINSKEVSMEMPYTKGSNVYIDNNYRKLNIKQSKDGKVRLTTTAFYYGEPAFTNEQWLVKLNITMKNTDTGIVITSSGINSPGFVSSSWSNTTTDWNKVIAERNKAVIEREKATIERSKASIERNRELVERNKTLLEQSRATTERNGVIPPPPAPPIDTTITRNGASSEVRVNGSGKYKGFRVMALNTNDRELAYKTKAQLISRFPEHRVDMSYQTPFFKLRIGDFLKKADAEDLRKQLSMMIKQGVYIVPDIVIMKEVDIDGWVNNISNEIRPARSYATSTGNSTAVFDERGNNVYNSSSLRRELTIYIPADVKLNVVSKYADVTADHNLKNLYIKISNGSLDMVNADNAIIISAYSNVSCGNLGNADISATNGKLSLKNVDQLNLNTKYTKVEIDNCNTLNLKSISDDYDLDAVRSISGTKTYGNFRLDKLTGSFNLNGSSADVKIRNIDPSVSVITIDNKYADVQLPVNGLKNYQVLFSGNYNSVFAPFERRDTTIEKQPEQSTGIRYEGIGTGVVTVYSGTANARKNSNGFSAVVGDTKGTHTIFKLVCNSCNVDFK